MTNNYDGSTGHLHQLEGEALMKDPVDLCTTGQVGGIHLISRPLYALLKVHTKLLHHPIKVTQHTLGVSSYWFNMHLHVCIWVYVGTDWSKALVLRVGSSGRKFLYSSTSFSSERSWLWSLLRNPGNVSRMWFVSCCREIKVKSPQQCMVGSNLSSNFQWLNNSVQFKTTSWSLELTDRLCASPGWGFSASAAYPCVLQCVCMQDETGRTSSQQPKQHGCLSFHQCPFDCGSPPRYNLNKKHKQSWRKF